MHVPSADGDGGVTIKPDQIVIEGSDGEHDVVNLPEYGFNEDVVADEIISIDGGGQIEIHDDHMSLVGSDGGDIADIDGDGVHVDLQGDWEAVIDIEGHGGVVVDRGDKDEKYYLTIGDDGLIDIVVEDADGNVIKIIDQKPGETVDIHLDGGGTIHIDEDGTINLPGKDGDAVARPDSEGGFDFGYNPSSGDGEIIINNDGIQMPDQDDVISLPDWIWDEDVNRPEIIELPDGDGEIEFNDDGITIRDDEGHSINIDHEGIRVDLDGNWEAVVDISDGENNGVNIHHKDPDSEWPSYQIDIGQDGNLVIEVLDKDGERIQLINHKPGQEIDLPLYGADGDQIHIDGDGTVHMPGPGGDAIAKPDGEGGWDFGQTPGGDGGIIIDNDGIHHPDFDDVISIPDWVVDPDLDRPDPDLDPDLDPDRPGRPDRPDDDISLPDWWPEDDRPIFPDGDRPDRPDGDRPDRPDGDRPDRPDRPDRLTAPDGIQFTSMRF